MVKPKTEQTKAQKDREAASVAFQKAKDANERVDNASTQKGLKEAQEHLRVAIKAENRERFVSVGTNRTRKARAAIRQLVKVANKKTYDYTTEEADRIVAGLKEAVNDVIKAFSATSTSAASGDDFKVV